MGSLFNLDAPIWVWMSEVADVIILTFLWWLCCIPIVTIGASTTAFFYVMGKKVRKENTYVVRDFFKSFKQNFKQSLLITIIMLIALVSASLYAFMTIEGLLLQATSLKWIIPITVIFIFEVVNIFTYLWAILSRFDKKTKVLVKTALVLTHKHLITTIANTFVFVITGYLIFRLPFLVVFAPGIIVTLSSFLMQNLFSRYITSDMPKTPEEAVNLEG